MEKAQQEINELADINIYYEPIFKGRKVVKVKFTIKEKSAFERAKSIAKTNVLLNKAN